MMIPAGVVEKTIEQIVPHLEAGDILIDGGNSYYIDDIKRAKELAPKGIEYVDVGTSGGVWGFERGYCMMIGGSKQVVEHLDPIFKTIAPGKGHNRGDARAGKSWAGLRKKGTCIAERTGRGTSSRWCITGSSTE